MEGNFSLRAGPAPKFSAFNSFDTSSIFPSVALALAVVVASAALLWTKNGGDSETRRLRRKLAHIPSPAAPEVDDVVTRRHHAMVDVHQKYGELVQLTLVPGGTPMLYLRGDEKSLKQFFTDSKCFSKNSGTFEHLDGAVDVINLVQPFLIDTLFEWEGKEWSSARKVINPFFAHPEVYTSTIRAVEAFLDASFSGDKTEFDGDLLSQVHVMIKESVVMMMGGYQMDEEDTVCLDEIIAHFVRRNMSDESRKAPTMNAEDATVFKRVINFGYKVLNYTRDNMDTIEPKALLKTMLRSGAYTDYQMVALFVNLLVAGGETPALAACKTLAAMAQDPAIMNRAVAEVDAVFAAAAVAAEMEDAAAVPLSGDILEKMTYVECCVMEGLRRYAPATVVGRRVVQDTELCGYRVPKDTNMQVSVHAVHMNPNVWPEPETFEPLRFDKEAAKGGLPLACRGDPLKNMIAFGYGTRACPGKKQYIKMCNAIIGGILRRCSVSAEGVNLDSFLPNRFVAWDVDGVRFKLTSRR